MGRKSHTWAPLRSDKCASAPLQPCRQYELYGVVDSIQTSFKLLFTPINNRMSSLALSSTCEGKPVPDVHKRTHWKNLHILGNAVNSILYLIKKIVRTPNLRWFCHEKAEKGMIHFENECSMVSLLRKICRFVISRLALLRN